MESEKEGDWIEDIRAGFIFFVPMFPTQSNARERERKARIDRSGLEYFMHRYVKKVKG